MKEHIFTIIIILIIFIPVFMLIKHSCYPIKTLPAILLTPLSIATCGIAIVIYKFIKGQYGVTNTTNYLGDNNFSDGTTTTSDNFENKYYH